MDIPADIQIISTLEAGSVFYFGHEDFEDPSIPHYFIVLNDNPKKDKILVLVCASSRVEKVKNRRSNCHEQTLVDLTPAEYIHLTTATVIDCNSVMEIELSNLIQKFKEGKLKICEKMPFTSFNLIKSGVLTSRLVEERKKNMVLG